MENKKCLECGKALRKFSEAKDWKARKYHRKCYFEEVLPREDARKWLNKNFGLTF